MKFAEFAKEVRTDGLKAALLRWLYNPEYSMDEAFIGLVAEVLGNRIRLEGATIHMDNPLLRYYAKGELVLGKYEAHERLLIQKHLPLDEPVIELGGSIGAIACVVNRKLAEPRRHVVVEPNADLLPTLRKNCDRNRCQFEIVEAAIGYGGDAMTFFTNEDSLTGSIYHEKGKATEVVVKTLQAIAGDAKFEHFNIISDIEGTEIEVIEHEIDFLREHVGTILIEMHFQETPYGRDGMYAAIEKLEANGFEKLDSIYDNYCFRNRASFAS